MLCVMEPYFYFEILECIFDSWISNHVCPEKDHLQGVRDCPHEASVNRVRKYFAGLITEKEAQNNNA